MTFSLAGRFSSLAASISRLRPRQSLEGWLRKQATNRLPHTPEGLGIRALRAATFGGLSNVAVPMLCQLGTPDAAKFAAQHHASRDNHTETIKCLGQIPSDKLDAGDKLMLAYALFRSGRLGEASEVLDILRASAGWTSDVAFTQANLSLPRSEAYFSALNTIYNRAGVAPIHGTSATAAFGAFEVSHAPPAVDDGMKVSILVPARNAETSLRFAIMSLVQQTWRNIEIIIVDDCSTDRTYTIARELADSDERIAVLRHKQNQGAYAARNTALAAASGRLVTVNDSDDWAHPQRIELQARHAQSTGVSVTATAAVRVSADMSLHLRSLPTTYLLPCFSSFMYERNLLTRLNGWDRVRFAADAELISRVGTLLDMPPVTVQPDVPLTLAFANSSSLTGERATGLSTMAFGARRQYISAYQYWHESIRGQPAAFALPKSNRAFQVPAICVTAENPVIRIEDLYVFDFTMPNTPILETLITRKRQNHSVAVFHWPMLRKNFKNQMLTETMQSLQDHNVQVVVTGEIIKTDTVIFSDRSLLAAWPDALPNVSANVYRFL